MLSVTYDSIHDCKDLINIFDVTFQELNTRLVKGDGEPIYLPVDESCSFNRIEFAHGFFSSALHEIAHWCIAGKQRRLLEDYGYWYCPDGRDEQQQAEFENVEVKPQAIEWCFSVACGLPFKVSTDNLNGAPVDRFAFQDKVLDQVKTYLQKGLPTRAAQLVEALRDCYQMPPLDIAGFKPEKQNWGHKFDVAS